MRHPHIATIIFVSFVVTFLLAAVAAAADDELQRYRHPRLDVQFSAPPGWTMVPRPEDGLIHEMMDEATGIHVVLWYTATEQDARRYLRKMADMKSVVVDGREPRRRDIDGREAWIFDVSAEIRGEAAHTLLTVIDGGAHPDLRDHNALYVVQIWCPAVRHPTLGKQMETILASVRMGG